MTRVLLLLAATFLASIAPPPDVAAAEQSDSSPSTPPPASLWSTWVEPEFPFFSSILDARSAGPGFPTNNLTPRGLILNLGNNCWAAFDVDLLRMAAIWHGPGVTPRALAPGSYPTSNKKTPGGQFPAPQPDGRVWMANGIYPGWQTGTNVTLIDPREPAPSREEVGRGPVSEDLGRFDSIQFTGNGAVLAYSVADAKVTEWFTQSADHEQPVVERHVFVGPSTKPLLLVLGVNAGGGVSLGLPNDRARSESVELIEESGHRLVRVSARPEAVAFCVTFTATNSPPPPLVQPRSVPGDRTSRDASALRPRWRQEVVSHATLSTAREAFVVDQISLPLVNPWRRNIRPTDIQFLPDGTGVVVTIDGDVWLVRGLGAANESIRWKRFASGLHEPMTCAIRDGQIYVFDRNGIWCLRDTNGDGEADRHELFSNAFAQTADMREFPSQIRLAPGGEFIIAKGGQQSTTLGKHNGSVLRVSADGRRATVLGHGFRQPNLGVNLRTGLIIASDQEGHYIPTTPLHIVRDGQYYGYLADGLQARERYPAPIAEPLAWIPHAVNASGMSQVWLFDAKMGPLNDALVHIGFNRPELFRVLLNNRTAKPQATVVSLARGFNFPPLHGAVNPTDGQLYIAGFQVIGWGNSLDSTAGLGRVRYTGAPVTAPREVVPMDQGVLLRFDVALDRKQATDPDSYSLATWNYIRTYNYGSPQLKADGTPGQDWLTPSSAYLSSDGHSVFIGVPGLKPAMQLRIGWSLASADGLAFEENAYTTPYELAAFHPRAEGFGDIEIDLTPRAARAAAATPISVEEGRRLAQRLGCVACHPTEGKDMAKIGPTWKGLFGSRRPVVAGKARLIITADDAYIRESILDPPAKFIAGFEKSEYAMPSYAGVVTDSQIESLVLYLRTLAEPPKIEQ